MLIDLEALYRAFAKHVRTLRSSEFVLSSRFSFESWFRVELVPVLWELGYKPDEIDTNYSYAGTGGKADLALSLPSGFVVFELKSFVEGQDSNKKQEYPRQIRRLEELVGQSQVIQAIAFTTFIGYSDLRMSNYLGNFFSARWHHVGPRKIAETGELKLVLSTLTSNGSGVPRSQG